LFVIAFIAAADSSHQRRLIPLDVLQVCRRHADQSGCASETPQPLVSKLTFLNQEFTKTQDFALLYTVNRAIFSSSSFYLFIKTIS